LPDIPGNATVCVSFIDPQYPDDFIFPAERLKTAVEPPTVLKPGQMPVQDYRTMYRNRNNFRRPQVGMAPYNKRASLDAGGHRMINHGLGNSAFGNVPPPNFYGGHDRYSQRQSPYQSSRPYHSGSYGGRQGGQQWGSASGSYGSSHQPQYGGQDRGGYRGSQGSRGGGGHWGAMPPANLSGQYHSPLSRYPDRNQPRDRRSYKPSGDSSYSSHGRY